MDNNYYQLLGRLVTLEEKVKKLEKELRDVQEQDVQILDEATVTQDKIESFTKANIVNDIIEKLSFELKDTNFIVRKAVPKNREGKGIYLEHIHDKTCSKKVMLKRSKYYPLDPQESALIFKSWFTADKSDLLDYDAYIFVVTSFPKPIYFVIDRKMMLSIMASKVIDKHERYHFYFFKNTNDKYFDDRVIGENIDLTSNVNGWTYLKNS